VPYDGEIANKASHSDIVRNPEVAEFLEGCEYLRPPSEEEVQLAIARFQVPPSTEGVSLGEHVVAIDGSYYEASIDDRLPSTKVGYVKIGCVLIDLAAFRTLRDMRTGFVDPMRVARLNDQNSPLTFTLPSANIRWGGASSVRDSFRYAVDSHLYGDATRFNPADPSTSMRTTLFHLAARRAGELGTGNAKILRVHRCPTCGHGPIELRDVPDLQRCPYCDSLVFPSDCLRIWEEVSDYQSNAEALSRFMLAIEHVLPIHYVRFLSESSPSVLSSMAIFVDGPLAVFGNPAWLHGPIMDFLHETNSKLAAEGQQGLLMIGLQKTGQVVDHLRLLDRFLPNNRLFPIDDAYRYEKILAGREQAVNGFGSETYYGQDFVIKTASGRSFVFALPYPFSSKISPEVRFVDAKTELGRYPNLARALALIQHFESDLYENAVVPVALAHRYTAISLVPGGRVLDLLSKRHVTANAR
jgi:hypothetical protein